MTTPEHAPEHPAAVEAAEHLWIRDLRRHPDGEVRLYSENGRLISGTWPRQVTASIDAMLAAAGLLAERRDLPVGDEAADGIRNAGDPEAPWADLTRLLDSHWGTDPIHALDAMTVWDGGYRLPAGDEAGMVARVVAVRALVATGRHTVETAHAALATGTGTQGGGGL